MPTDDATPWMIGGGIEHSVEVARLVSYLAAGGSEGIVGVNDLQVRETAPPSGSIRVAPGACSILNKATGAAYDAYASRFPIETVVPIAATGSGAARADLIIARIENPYESGEPWVEPTPEDIAAGNAVFRRIAVISGVPADQTVVPTNLGYSAIPLARVNIPAGTATITQAMITDLRKPNFSAAMFGLQNVNNTSDANKPISTAAQAALDALTNAVASKIAASSFRASESTIVFNNQGTGTQQVNFVTPFPAGVVPRVVGCVRTNSNYILTVSTVTNTGFLLTATDRLFRSASLSLVCTWVAIAGALT